MNKILKSYLSSHDKDNECNQLHLTNNIFLVEKQKKETKKNKKEKLKVCCNSSFYKVDVDNCLIKDSEGDNPKKCDFIVGSHENQFVFLIELKSESDLKKIISQFESTSNYIGIQKQNTICIVAARKFNPSGIKKGLKIALKKIKFNYFFSLSYNDTLNIDEKLTKLNKQ